MNDLPEAPLDTFGPAMRALNDRRRAFVTAFLDSGGEKQTEAARAAGYQGDDNSVKVTACRLVHNDSVLAALREESLKRMQAYGPRMFGVLTRIATDTKAPAAVQLKAAEAVLDRIGLHGLSEQVVRHEDGSRGEIVRALVAVLKEAGLDFASLAPRREMIDVTPAASDE